MPPRLEPPSPAAVLAAPEAPGMLEIALDTTDPVEVMGDVDAQKLHSSMTLFALAAPDQPVFREVLDHYFDGELDEGTTSRV